MPGMMKPGAMAGLRNANACEAGSPENSAKRAQREAARVLFEANNGPKLLHLSGRLLFTLRLLASNKHGITSLDYPALRLAAYVHRLRNLGFSIETVREPHAGAFPGFHARYRLAQPVPITGGAT